MRRYDIIAAALVLLLASTGNAQEANYQPYPMGERAMGMGGAFTAMAGYPIASFYNPAALVSGQSLSLSGSLNVYGSVSRTITNGGWFGAWEVDPINPDVDHPVLVDLEYSEFPPATVPISSVIVQRLGRRTPHRTRPHAFAWSTLVPRASNFSYSIGVDWDFDADPSTPMDQHRLSFREEDKLMLMGASYAYEVSRHFSFGISAFAAIRSYTYRFHHTWFNSDPTSTYAGIQVRELDIASEMYSGVFRLGALWHLDDHWRLGVMVQLPSFEIWGQGSYAARELDTFTGEYALTEIDDLEPNDRLPLEIRAGAAYEDQDSWAVALDVTFYGPLQYDRFETPRGYTELAFVDRIERQAIANVNLGGEIVIARSWPVRLGFFTDLSSAPEVVASNFPTSPRIHTVGGTLSVGYIRNGFNINVGVLGSVGSGEAHTRGPQTITGDPWETYVPTQARERRLYFFVTGAQRALGDLAGRVLDRLEGRRDERQAEDAEEASNEEASGEEAPASPDDSAEPGDDDATPSPEPGEPSTSTDAAEEDTP